jgi:hypothetical protein
MLFAPRNVRTKRTLKNNSPKNERPPTGGLSWISRLGDFAQGIL